MVEKYYYLPPRMDGFKKYVDIIENKKYGLLPYFMTNPTGIVKALLDSYYSYFNDET